MNTKTSGVRELLTTLALALSWTLLASGIGLAVNRWREKGIPIVAPFSYDHDCPEKLDAHSPTVAAPKALALVTSKRVKDEKGRKGAVLVDVRPGEDFEKGHVTGALSYPYSFVTPFSKKDAAQLKQHAHIFVYCDSPGDRLAQTQAELMKKQGLDQVKVVRGGFDALMGRSPAPSNANDPQTRQP